MKVKSQMSKVKGAWKMLKVSVCIVFVCILISAHIGVSYAQENIQVYGVEGAAGEKDEGRSFLKCLEGWRQFTASVVGYESFTEYWYEIFYVSWHSPTLFADITNIQDQLNKSRYAVMAAFLRCDLDRLKSVTEAYYRLEAELYYVRNFVNIGGGYVEKRKRFADELADYLLVLKAAADKEKERAVYTGYFDLFEAKYAERARLYASHFDDTIFTELGAKFDELIETFKSFQTLGAELKNLGEETGQAIAEGATAVGTSVAAFQKPGKALKDLASNISNRFKICPTTEHPDKCITFVEAVVIGGSAVGKTLVATGKAIGDVYDKIVEIFSYESLCEKNPIECKKQEKKTYEDIKKAIERRDVLAEEQAIKSKMLARYELLYGQVSGEGVLALMNSMDELLKTLGPSQQGSLEPLEKAGRCAKRVKNRVCSENF